VQCRAREHRHCTGRCSCDHKFCLNFHLQGYAWEITTPEGGWGLDGVLQGVQHKLDGIANGIDTTEWSPETDDHLPASYSAADMSGGFQGGSMVPLVNLCTAAGQAPGWRLPQAAPNVHSGPCQVSMPSLLRVQARRRARRPCSGNWGCRRTLESRCWASSDA
jgi:hypothetical protein